MSKSQTNTVLFRLKFIDLYKVPLEGLYHIVTINGRTACSGASIGGYTVSIKDPRNGLMINIIKDLIVPLKKTTFEVQAPFAKHKFKLKMFEGSAGDYLRKTHKVEPEETLSSIGEIHGVNWQQIAQLNNLREPYKIVPGDILKLPPVKARQQSSGQSKPQSNSQSNSQGNDLQLRTEYKVQKNETLSGISQRSGVPVAELKRLNGITDPKTLKSGQTIKLRDSSSASSPATQPIAKPSTSSNSPNNKEKGLLDRAKDAVQEMAENLKEGFEDFNDTISGTKEEESADSPRSFQSKPTQRKNNEESDNSDSANSSQSKQPSNPIETQASEDRGQTGTPKVDVTKLGDCSCNRDLTLGELEEIVSALRKAEKITRNDLFYDVKCTLPESQKKYSVFQNELNKIFKKYDINTCIRRIHFLAQLYHESDRFRTTIEYADGTYYNPPNASRKTHPDAVKNGNTKMGDGPKYRGRGLIQLTWKNNYKLYKSYSNNDVVSNYTMIDTSLAVSCDVSGWFWTQGKILIRGEKWRGYPKINITSNGNNYHTINMNIIADDITKTDSEITTTITFLVNGGDNGLDHRKANVKKLRDIFKYPSQCVSTGVEKPKIEKASNNIAPWMDIAIREGKEWYGKTEDVIDDTDSYFRLINFLDRSYDEMTNRRNAWCAAFVNYCLQESKFTKVSGTGDDYDVIRANGFRLDTVNFKKIDKPVYGAIAVIGKSHVGLVLGTVNNTEFYRLGGNQSDKITIDIRTISSHTFYVPTTYYQTAINQDRAEIRSESDMKALRISWVGRDKGSTT